MVKRIISCDRCGKECEGTRCNRGYHVVQVHDDECLDLCQKCYDGLYDWINSAKMKELQESEASVQIVIDISEQIYLNAKADMLCGGDSLVKAIKSGIPLPRGHGRLIDADAFISALEDSSKRNKYKELLIDDCLTVDGVFKAVIESLQNKGTAEGDTPTIIEADKESEGQGNDT